MFCKTVWNGMHILPDGQIRLCSIGTNSKPALDMQRCRSPEGKQLNIIDDELIDIMNSDKHREIRRLNVKNPESWSPHCDCCENREIITDFDREHTNKSRRVYLMGMQTDETVSENDFATKMADDGSVDWLPSSLDIRFGNLCNQKCIMCNPTFSNLWYDEWFDYYKNMPFGQGDIKVKLERNPNTNKWIQPKELQWFEDPRFWKRFDQLAPHLRHIYITGGEPMVTPAHDEMLDKLIDGGYANNIWLEYDTNCSTINRKIADRWKHFGKVELRGSMDAIKDQYEIVRYGGKWDKFVENVKKLQEYQVESNGTIELLAVSTCFQMSTMFSIIESEQWCKEIGVGFHLRFLEGPIHHSVASLPDVAKLKLIDYYTQHIATSEKAEIIIKHLKNHLGEKYHKPKAVKEFVKFMNYLDTTRKTDWKAVFPEVVDLIKESSASLAIGDVQPTFNSYSLSDLSN
jgi:hypothetical protein